MSPGAAATPGMMAPTVKAPPAPAAGAAAPATVKPAANPTVKPAAKPAVKASGGHYAQLGAFTSKASAETAWHKLSGRFAGQLKSLQPHYAVATSHGKQIVRLQVALPSLQRVHALCAELKKQSQACLPAG